MASIDHEIHVGSLAEVQARSPLVVSDGPVPIVLFHHEGKIYAVDNRCPHMGFPLNRGTVEDGILTCHWHHARFDLASGCTFNLFADDVDAYPVRVKGGEVYLSTVRPQRDPVARWSRRLREGMEQNLSLIIGKSVIGLLHGGVTPDEIAKLGALYGVRHRQDWASGLTILSAMANLCDRLEGNDRIAPLFHGLVHVARDCAGMTPKFEISPLDNEEIPHEHLKRWLRYFVEVRSTEGAERCLLTAVQKGMSGADIADMIVTAATDHFYLDGGHVVDFINKAFELLDRIGWDHADRILPSLVNRLCTATRSEEQNAWRHPIDLLPVLRGTFEELPGMLAEGAGKTWARRPDFADQLLVDDPFVCLDALKGALREGAKPVQLAQAVAYVAALRIVRFHVQNEFADWIAALHTFTYANALHQLLKRTESTDLLRGVFHGVMRCYLDRFFNIPPARMPSGNGEASDRPEAALQDLLNLMNIQQQTDAAGQRVYSYLHGRGDSAALFRTLTESLLREDAEFHSFQVLEAAIRQHGELEDEEEKRLVMVAAARYLAAHAPTQRALNQTLRIAVRLHRGDPVYEAEAV